jgi:hypothetical protein
VYPPTLSLCAVAGKMDKAETSASKAYCKLGKNREMVGNERKGKSGRNRARTELGAVSLYHSGSKRSYSNRGVKSPKSRVETSAMPASDPTPSPATMAPESFTIAQAPVLQKVLVSQRGCHLQLQSALRTTSPAVRHGIG